MALRRGQRDPSDEGGGDPKDEGGRAGGRSIEGEGGGRAATRKTMAAAAALWGRQNACDRARCARDGGRRNGGGRRVGETEAGGKCKTGKHRWE